MTINSKKALTITAILLSLTTGMFGLAAQAKPNGATTCDGTELNLDGTLDEQRYLYLMGHGSAFPRAHERQRTVSLERFFSIPRVHFPSNREISMVEGITQTLIFHAAAAKFGLQGITANLVQSNSNVVGFSYHERANLRPAENVRVTLAGANSSLLACQQFATEPGVFNKDGAYSSKAGYFKVANGEIIDPRSLMTYSCSLAGRWDDIAPALYTVLKESVAAQSIDAILYEKEISDSITAPGTSERNAAVNKAAIAFHNRTASKAQFFEFSRSMSDWRRSNKMQVQPVNRIVLNQNYSTSPTLTDVEALNAKAFVVFGSGGCNASLVCTRQNCWLMSDEAYLTSEAALSVVEH